MSTEQILRDHFEALADDVVLTPAGADAVTGRVQRSRWIWGLVAAAAVAVSVVVGAVAFDGERELASPLPGLSAAGLEWQSVSVSLDAGPVIQVIAARDGGFLLLTDSQRWFRSADGVAWEEHEAIGLGEDADITMIANAGNRLVAAGRDNKGRPLLATSLDGVSWEGAGPGDQGSTPVSIAAVGDTVLVPYIDESYHSTVYRFSLDEGWVQVDPPEPTVQVLAMSALDGVFVAQVTDPRGGFPHRDYRSQDGIEWKEGAPIPMIQVNKPLTQPIVAGPDGWYLTSFGGDDVHRFLKSNDGETWGPVGDTVFGFGPPLLVGDETGVLAVLPAEPGRGIDDGGLQMLFSSDGATWETQILGDEIGSRWLAGALTENLVLVGGGLFEGGASAGEAMETVVWVARR